LLSAVVVPFKQSRQQCAFNHCATETSKMTGHAQLNCHLKSVHQGSCQRSPSTPRVKFQSKKNFQHLDIEASSPEKGLNSIGRLALAHQACASGLMDRSFISIDA
jgi:hypothetical protein